jgi:cyanophycinase-like exopeptidase
MDALCHERAGTGLRLGGTSAAASLVGNAVCNPARSALMSLRDAK